MISNIIDSIIKPILQSDSLRNAAKTFIVRVLAAGLAFVVQVYLAHSLSIADYGIYASLWTWMLVVTLFAALGFSESSLRFLPRYAQRGQNQWALGFLRAGFIFALGGAITIGGAGLIVLLIFKEIAAPEYVAPLIIVALGLPAMTLEIYLMGVSRSQGWFMLTVVPGYIVRPLFIALGVFTLQQFGLVPDAVSIMALVVVITAAIVTFQSVTIWRRFYKQFGPMFKTPIKKVWVKSSLPLTLIAGVDELYAWSDILILGFLMPAPEVAIYFAAQRSMSLASFIQYAFMMVTSREFSLAKAMRDHDELQRRIYSATKWTFWLTVPAVLMVLAVGYPVLSLFGSRFVDGYPVMLALGLGFIIRASVGQSTDLLVVTGHQMANFWISGIGLLFNIVFSIVLVPYMGILGVAVATSITFALRTIVVTITVRKLTGFNFWEFQNKQIS